MVYYINMKDAHTHNTKVAFITGITGQDGSYLAELLLSKGYEVHGLVRRSSVFNTERIDSIYQGPQDVSRKLFLHFGDLTDASNIHRLVREINPDEIYNLGAQSHVRVSFDMPEYTAESVALGTLRILESLRQLQKPVRLYQAGSSEMFGEVLETPQKETTPFNPASPYGVSKVFAHEICKNYRKSYGMFICNGILFNHESPRRGKTFVTRKITRGVAAIAAGKLEKLYLGNLDSKRDWGYAAEYVEAMWKMLQQDTPDDYVIATGETHTIREFLDEAFALVGIDSWEKYVGIDEKYFRPQEVELLLGDASKAKEKLGWEPKVKFKDLVKIMLEADLKEINAEHLLIHPHV